MERYNIGFDGVRASADCKRRMIDSMRRLAAQPVACAQKSAPAYRMPRRRRALLIAIAAVLLLLSACAAYAIYWSSTQRAKDNATAQLAQPVDEWRQAAEDAADEYLSAVTLTAPLTGSASVGGVTIEMNSVDIFQDADGAEYVFHYTARSDSVGFVTSFAEDAMEGDPGARARLGQYETFCELGMDARDFVLTIDGQAFTPYHSPDYEGAPQIASGWDAPDDARAWTSSFMLRANPFPITQDSQMHLSGTLYACDRAGKRTGALGSFSIDFDYRYPAEQAEEARQAYIAEFGQSQQSANAARLDTLGGLPAQAAPVGLMQNAYTLTDVAALPDGLLIGERVTRPEPCPDGFELWAYVGENKFYLDGYEQYAEIMDESWETEGAASTGLSMLRKVPYYRPADRMPEELLVYVTRHTEWYDNDAGALVVDKYIEPLELVFRVNRKTGAVALPADDAEKAAWLSEHHALAADGRNDARDYRIHRSQTVNGMTVLLERLQYLPESNTFRVHALIPVITCQHMPLERDPVVTMDGEALCAPQRDTYFRTVDRSPPLPPYTVNIEEWVETYGLDTTRFCWYDYTFAAPARITEMPETFTLGFTWDVYDLNGQAERTLVGTFRFATEIHRDAYTAFRAADRGYENEWVRAAMSEYGIQNER